MLDLPHHHVELDGPELDVTKPVVIVIPGMSTTPATLKAGYPAPPDHALTKLYWHLPIVREGSLAVQERRHTDVFRHLFAPVVDEARQELKTLVNALAGRPLGLFGFSIGGLIALWGALDNPEVTALVAVGGVPNLNYLQHYYPDYPWSDASIQAQLRTYDVLPHISRLPRRTAVLICHGARDEVAQWQWMQPFADHLQRHHRLAQVQQFLHLKHQLWADGPDEDRDLTELRTLADWWFVRYCPGPV
ncbi:MAG: hypothetical protein C7B45_09435 [Sulfobacillus acidophilus]|uniref:Peptidase S9 prolyl oligopeptidase catalytic domain-containing protein n=1 Tax=Sulfobacillus acidophilus TaxID=53633 RepID=A0A2T2WHU3_9FIRM|nr:MAG: hypothetical protein C7B45_09435 [Sulfobacillus acidophilus]